MDIDMPPKRVVNLSVTQDTTCAFCFIGWRELQAAIRMAEAKELPIEFRVEFKPYRLDDGLTPHQPTLKNKYYMEKYGSERFAQVKQVVTARGERLGIDFTWDGVFRQNGNCQRVLRYAFQVQRQKGASSLADDVQARLLNELFAASFERAEDIGDPETLAKYCELAGLMSKDQALAFIASPALTEEVQGLIDEAVTQGITGVPFTVINSKWAVQGGQSADVYYGIFEKLATCNGPCQG